MKEYKVTIDIDGIISYYKPGTDILHREVGPAVEWADGTKHWCINGILHREDGPAVDCPKGVNSRYMAWFVNGKKHREDGPAVEWDDGTKHWYINGVKLTKQEFNDRTKVVELSLEEIAKKFNMNVNNLKIKKLS